MENTTTTEESLKFIKDYVGATNAANGSKYDANANVTNKNIATMSWEVPKKDNFLVNRALMHEQITKMYGPELADQYIKDLEHHIIYKHDETTLIPDYCASISLYPFLLDGLKKLGGTSEAPKNIDSFVGSFTNLLFIVASQLAGAVATPEWLTYMDHFLRKDYGEDYIKDVDKVVEIRKKSMTLGQKIDALFQQVIYTVNQPAAARGSQSIFWNIAYFDHPYFENLFKGFVFPDGDEPKWETTSWLQKRFMKWFNAERLKTVITFPVETMNLLTDENGYVDKEWADFAAEMWSEGASFFVYRSNSIDALASCCFDGSQKVLTRSSDGGVWLSTFKEIADETYRGGRKSNLKVYHNGSWIPAKTVKLPKTKMLKVTLANNKELLITTNHINPTLRGDIEGDKLTTNDYLLTNSLILDTFHEKDLGLTYEQGYLLGLYAGDGSRYERKNCNSCEVTFSLNHEKNDKSKSIIEKAMLQLKATNALNEYTEDNLYTLKTCSREVKDFLDEWACGNSADTKELNLGCLEQSIDFRKGIIDGMYDSDGGNSNRIYSVSEKLIEDLEVILSSLGYNSIINLEDRRGKIEIKGEEFNRNFITRCIRWYDRKNKRSMGDVYIVKNNSVYFKVKSIENYESDDPYVYCMDVGNDEEPYFTLPNNIITHNCRLRNAIEDNVFSYTLGAGAIETGSKGVITMNLNRIVQDWYGASKSNGHPTLPEYLAVIVERVQKYLTAFNEIVWYYANNNMLEIYPAGFGNLDKKYLTIGINGFVEGAEFLGCKINAESEGYKQYAKNILKTIADLNKKNRTEHCRFNTEFTPSENLGVKNAKWDKKDGYVVPRDVYNSYFYVVEDEHTDILEKFMLHGKDFTGWCDGGSALHMNLANHLTKKQYRMLLDVAWKVDCPYFTYNIRNTVCNDCGYISKKTLDVCPKCGSHNLDYLSRVIGYLRRISNYSQARQEEAAKRYYANGSTLTK